MPPDIELQPGQTAVVRISNHLTYRVTHTGWVLDVTSTQPISVKPTNEKSLSLIAIGFVEEDLIA